MEEEGVPDEQLLLRTSDGNNRTQKELSSGFEMPLNWRNFPDPLLIGAGAVKLKIGPAAIDWAVNFPKARRSEAARIVMVLFPRYGLIPLLNILSSGIAMLRGFDDSPASDPKDYPYCHPVLVVFPLWKSELTHYRLIRALDEARFGLRSNIPV